MNPRPLFRLAPVAAAIILAVGCEGAPETDAAEPGIAELKKTASAECQRACQLVVSCLGGGSGSYGGGYGDGYGGYGEGYGGYGDGYGGYGDGYGGYGDGCGGYGNGYGGYGEGYGGYGGGYGDGYGGYGDGYGGYGCGYAECGGGASSPEWCGYGGYGDGYGGYGNLPGYGGTCAGGGSNMLAQCVAGCQALPPRARGHLLACVNGARTCQARLACE